MKEREPRSDEPPAQASASEQHAEAEVQRVRQVLEDARQRVKPLIKRELEGEIVSSELLNFRLKNAGRA